MPCRRAGLAVRAGLKIHRCKCNSGRRLRRDGAAVWLRWLPEKPRLDVKAETEHGPPPGLHMAARLAYGSRNANCNVDNSSQRRSELPRRSLSRASRCQRNRDQRHREQRAARDLIDSGSVFVNEPVRSDPRFGGKCWRHACLGAPCLIDGALVAGDAWNFAWSIQLSNKVPQWSKPTSFD